MPQHKAGDRVFIPLLQKLWRTAVSDDGDPEIGATIMETFRRRVASDDEWMALLRSIPEYHMPA